MARRTSKAVTKKLEPYEVEQLITEYAVEQAKAKAIEAAIEQRVAEIKAEYSDKSATIKTKIKDVTTKLQMYAELNAEDFEKTRSKIFLNGRIGFRKGTQSVRFLRKLKVDAVVELVKKFAPQYLRTKEELNKKDIIANCEELEKDGLLEKMGVKVGQTERFFVEANEVDLNE